jgi:leucyl aminopeptidase (aminopeptidase T)
MRQTATGLSAPAATRGTSLVLLLTCACATSAPTVAFDQRAVADMLVDRVAHVRAGEKVLILGEPRFAVLLEELWLATRTRGAHPLIELGGPDLFERYFAEVPATRDADTPVWDLALADAIDVLIEVQPHHPEVLRRAPVDRLAAVTAALEPAEERKIARKVRQIYVGNGLLPTTGMAERHGLSERELEQIFWASITVDPETLRQRGQRVKQAVEGGRRVHITHANGTDLSMEITGRPTFLSTGSITPEDTAAGASGIVFLPSGEVWWTPVPGTTSGRLVIDRLQSPSGDIETLTLTVTAGAVTAVTADPSPAFDTWRAQFDAAPAGKEQLSWVAIGLNPEVRPPPGRELLNFVASGMVTLGLGKNTWAGGDNAVAYGVFLFLPGANVTADDVAIVRDGVPL